MFGSRAAYNTLLLFIMCSIWAGNYFVIKESSVYLNPVLLALFRSLGSGALLMLVARSEIKKLSTNDIWFLALIGFFQVSIFYVTLNLGLLTINSSVAATLVYTQPVFVVALSPLIGERLSFFKVVGVIAAFIGVGTIFLPDIEKSSLAIGDVLELVASLSWVTSILLYKKWKHGLSYYAVPGMQNLLGSLFIVPFLALGPVYLVPLAGLWIDLAYIIVLGSGVAYVIYFRALSSMDASVFSSYLFLVPTLTSLYESLLTHTLPGPYQIAGTALVSAGIILVNRRASAVGGGP